MRFVTLCLLAACSGAPKPATPAEQKGPPAPARTEIVIARGTAVVIDGVLDPDEWRDAKTVSLEVEPGWSATVRFKHDGTALAFAFDGLRRGEDARYPEIMLDAKHDGGLVWTADDWWFHASFRDCWSAGKYNDYASCIAEAANFRANNYVDQNASPAAIEIAIPFATLGVASGQEVGIAFDLTDTMKTWSMWPARAQLAVPASWGTARIE